MEKPGLLFITLLISLFFCALFVTLAFSSYWPLIVYTAVISLLFYIKYREARASNTAIKLNEGKK